MMCAFEPVYLLDESITVSKIGAFEPPGQMTQKN